MPAATHGAWGTASLPARLRRPLGGPELPTARDRWHDAQPSCQFCDSEEMHEVARKSISAESAVTEPHQIQNQQLKTRQRALRRASVANTTGQ